MSDQPTGRQLLALAREGDLEPLLHLCDIDGDGEGDILAYKWLNVASDFGHVEADDMIDDVMEVSSLRYDDDSSVTGGVHFDLGVAYLTGGDGLPLDLDLGQSHLAHAVECRYPAGIQGGDELVAQARAALTGAARAVFDGVYRLRG
jgi:hypothetical protein